MGMAMALSQSIVVLLLLGICYADPVSLSCGPNNEVKITETPLDSPVRYVHWVRPENKIVFVRTANRGLYRSADGGATWTSVLQYLQNSQNPMPPTGYMGVQQVLRTSDDLQIYFLGLGGNLWVTKDGGVNYQRQPGGPNFVQLSIHPTKPDWLLGIAWADDCYTADGVCYNRLLLSQDEGNKWREIDTYVYQYSWAMAGRPDIADETIWALDWEDKSGDQSTKFRSTLELQHTVDFFDTKIEHPIDQVTFFLYGHEKLFFAREPTSNSLELWISEDNGQNFIQAHFPLNLAETQYGIVDDTEYSIFISVAHGQSDWLNLYSSDARGEYFDLSLEHERRNEYGVPDFHRVHGLKGIFFANQLKPAGDITLPRTLISYDEGGEWVGLPPAIDKDGKDLPCPGQDCGLHLHLDLKTGSNAVEYGYFGPMHSRSEAIGLVVATGNLGSSLHSGTDPNNVSTFFSRNGGLTWYLFSKGSHTSEYADHGSLILMAPNIEPTKNVTYTWDQGLSFVSCQITNGDPVDIGEILVEPSNQAQEFLVYGVRDGGQGNYAVMYHLDFNGLHERVCSAEDYEQFTPADNTGSTCLLGQSVSYKRRKRDSACFNPDEFETESTPTRCTCTMEDYECDFCHEKNTLGECERVIDCTGEPTISEMCENSQKYHKTKGYRLVAGDTCNPAGGLDLLPEELPCPGTVKSGGSSALLAVMIVLLVLAMLGAAGGAAFYIYRRRHNRPLGFLGLGGDMDSTALDDDLLEDRGAEEIDDSTIQQTISSAPTVAQAQASIFGSGDSSLI